MIGRLGSLWRSIGMTIDDNVATPQDIVAPLILYGYELGVVSNKEGKN